MVIVVCTLIDNKYASYLFSKAIFTYCFCMLSLQTFLKGESDEVAHLHNEARALSSPSRYFQLSTNLSKDIFRYP